MKKAAVLFAAMIFTVLLVSCAEATLPEPTAEELLATLTEEFASRKSATFDGRIFYDGILVSRIHGTADDEAKRIFLREDDEDYLYFNRYLLKSASDGFIVEKTATSYAATLKKIPFSLFDFVYSAKNRGDIYMTDGLIVITFIDRGVKNTFSSSRQVSGGVFAVSHDGKRITGTSLTTTLTENGVSGSYSVRYSYGDGGSAFTEIPWVTPADTVSYALYAVNTLAESHGDDTLHVASSGKDTGVMLGSVVLDSAKISDVFVISLDDTSINLNIVYSEKVMVVGLSSAISEIQISYGTDYRVTSLTVNGGTRYYLR